MKTSYKQSPENTLYNDDVFYDSTDESYQNSLHQNTKTSNSGKHKTPKIALFFKGLAKTILFLFLFFAILIVCIINESNPIAGVVLEVYKWVIGIFLIVIVFLLLRIIRIVIRFIIRATFVVLVICLIFAALTA